MPRRCNGVCFSTTTQPVKPPLHQDKGALNVIAGGTGAYRRWTGTCTDRVFVGFGAPTSGVGGIVYDDQLWFSISGQQAGAFRAPVLPAPDRAR